MNAAPAPKRPLPDRLTLRALLLLSMLVPLAGTPWAAAASDPLDQVLALMAQRQHGEVQFVDEQHLAMLSKPLRSSGELIYDAPDRLEKRTLKPRPETMVYAGGVLKVTRAKRSFTLEANNYPQLLPFLESIRATLAGDRAALERVFIPEFSGSSEAWVLQLTPRDPALQKLVRQIRIEGSGDAVRLVEIRQVDGDRWVTTMGAQAP